MNPLLLSLLTSFGPSVFSKLFGGDPMKKLRQQLLEASSPANVAKLTNQFYQQQVGSPAYSQAQGTIAAGANQTANQLAGRLGAAGIGTSGTGALLSSLTPSLVGSQQAGLRTAAYNSAQGQANDAVQRQIQALSGTGGPSQTQQLFGGGLDAFIPYLQSLLKQRQGLPYGDMSQAAGMGTGYSGSSPLGLRP